MTGFAVKEKKQDKSTNAVLRQRDCSARRENQTEISSLYRERMEKDTDQSLDGIQGNGNLGLPAKMSSLAYTRENQVETVQKMSDNVVQRAKYPINTMKRRRRITRSAIICIVCAFIGDYLGVKIGGVQGGIIGLLIGAIIGALIEFFGGASQPQARYVESKISQKEYYKLRSRTPSKEIRDKVNENIDELQGQPDPAIPDKFITGKLQADHIVPMRKIVEMDGFDQLNDDQRLKVLNYEDNFMGLTRSANASKGSKSYAEWHTYKKENLPIREEFRQKMIKLEKGLAGILQELIDRILGRS